MRSEMRALVQRAAPVPPRRIARVWPLPARWAGPVATIVLAAVAWGIGGWR